MRPPEEKDARQIACCVNDKDMARNLARLPHPYAPKDALDWVAYTDKAREQGTEYAFVITHEEAGVIGSVGFNRTRGAAWEIGYWVDKAVQGKGVATEAAAALMKWGAGKFGVTQFVAGHFQDNPASALLFSNALSSNNAYNPRVSNTITTPMNFNLSESEIIRVLLQFLENSGYERTVQCLSDESGLNNSQTKTGCDDDINALVMDGNWEKLMNFFRNS